MTRTGSSPPWALSTSTASRVPRFDSPLHRADRIRTPLLILQGAKDPRVPQVESEQIVAAFRKKGGVAEYILFPDEGRGWARLPNPIGAYRATADLLDRHLKGAASQAGQPRDAAAPGR